MTKTSSSRDDRSATTTPSANGRHDGDKVSKYRRHLLRAQAARNHFTFRRDFVTSGLMTRDEALFFQDLLNHAAMCESSGKTDDGGWFLCTVKYLRRSLGWSKDIQARLINALMRKDFIDCRR